MSDTNALSIILRIIIKFALHSVTVNDIGNNVIQFWNTYLEQREYSQTVDEKLTKKSIVIFK